MLPRQYLSNLACAYPHLAGIASTLLCVPRVEDRNIFIATIIYLHEHGLHHLYLHHLHLRLSYVFLPRYEMVTYPQPTLWRLCLQTRVNFLLALSVVRYVPNTLSCLTNG